MSSVQIFWHRHGACRSMRWIIPSFGRGQGLVEIVDYLLRVLEPASAGNKLRLRQILHFIKGSGRDMDVKQLSLPVMHRSRKFVSHENLPPNWPDQQHQLHSVFPVQLALQRNAVQPKGRFPRQHATSPPF
ncbi:hypothetical protein NKH81_22535 [Mesorhizobium sp. M0959]|uniref:hypothetical protein n=2 Tax=unclassified Mesorhizobium TaxID=325217 RepID=UPI00333C9703